MNTEQRKRQVGKEKIYRIDMDGFIDIVAKSEEEAREKFNDTMRFCASDLRTSNPSIPMVRFDFLRILNFTHVYRQLEERRKRRKVHDDR